MLKRIACLTACLATLATPAAAQQQNLVEEVFNIYQPSDTSFIIYVPQGDDGLLAWTLTDTMAVESLLTCGPQALRDAVTSQPGAGNALPAQGFSTIKQYVTFLKNENIQDGKADIPPLSARFYGCPVDLKNAHYGVFCADSTQRDGAIVYDHCIPSRREAVELDPALVRGEDEATEE